MKNKVLYYSLLSVFGAVVIAIVVLCAIYLLSPGQNSSPNNNPKDESYCYFNYGDDVDLLYGDTFSLAPTNEELPLFYAPMTLGIVNISEDGTLTTQKCGDVTVKIWDGEELVKTVDISIKIKYSIVDVNNCSIDGNTITMNRQTCSFNICAINSKDKTVHIGEPTSITTSEDLTAEFKFGSIWLTATKNGKLALSFPAINAECEMNIVAG